jgi:hypothetical protein
MINPAQHLINIIRKIFHIIPLSCFLASIIGYQLHAEEFLYGTQVKTPTGYVAIEKLQVHNSVICCDDNWAFAEQSVIAINQKQVTHYIKIIIGNESICATINQKFYIPKKQAWFEAQTIIPGDMLLSNHLTLVKVDNVINVNEEANVYSITVDGYHNYCVSSLDIHVHNFIPAIALGISWAFGSGAVEFTGATLAVVGTAMALTLSRKNNKQKIEISIEPNIGEPCNNNGPSEDPNDKKQKRDKARNDHRPLTNKEARQKAQELGYTEAKNPPFNPHGKPAFRKGNDWISPDRKGHKGGVWKKFTKTARKGTYNINLTERIGD